jgi:hypothetical protein
MTGITMVLVSVEKWMFARDRKGMTSESNLPSPKS